MRCPEDSSDPKDVDNMVSSERRSAHQISQGANGLEWFENNPSSGWGIRTRPPIISDRARDLLHVCVIQYTNHYHELADNTSHADYTFLVLRNMYYRFRYNPARYANGGYYTHIWVPFMCIRLMDQIQYLEHAIEWPIFDEFLHYYFMTRRSEDSFSECISSIDVILRCVSQTYFSK